jgi:hypothetical protein
MRRLLVVAAIGAAFASPLFAAMVDALTAMLDPAIRKDHIATMPAFTVYAGTPPVVTV